jgi:predicted Zn-dependent protease
MREAGSGYGVEEDERKLIRQADAYEAELRSQGLLYQDPELQAYVDGVATKLLPSLPPGVRFRFHVLREPTINAFALPQGAIQLHLGLLARLDNEAQLAHVLGHEITHTVNRHHLRFVRSLQNKTVAAKIASMAILPPAAFFGGGGVANLANLILGLSYAAAVTGYGREMEQEADHDGLRLMAGAGYPVEEAGQVFERLNEIEDPGALENFFYGSHPANSDRARYTRELVAKGFATSLPGADAHAERYQGATRKVALENVRLRLRAKHYAYARQEAETALARRGDDPWLRYYVGEAHRLAAEDPKGAAREHAFRKREQPDDDLVESYEKRASEELDAAAAAFRHALELDPSLAIAHRGLGLVARQRGDRETARRELDAYVQAVPASTERRWIDRILRELAP